MKQNIELGKEPVENVRVSRVTVNIIGVTTIPFFHWVEQPLKGVCDGSTITSGGSGSTGSHTGGSNTHTGGGSNTHTDGGSNTHVTQAPAHTHTQRPSNTYQSHDFNSNNKFILELNEPGDNLPGQTRKFVLYFSSPVRARVDSSSSEGRF